MNDIGKFQIRQILDEFDAALIDLHGVSMRDAPISRCEALGACNAYNGPSKAAEIYGRLRDLQGNPA